MPTEAILDTQDSLCLFGKSSLVLNSRITSQKLRLCRSHGLTNVQFWARLPAKANLEIVASAGGASEEKSAISVLE